MQPSQNMTAEEVLALLYTLDDKQLQTAIPIYQLSLETVQGLKDYSAQFHFTEPEHALQIAQAAYRLGQQLPAPAPALGAWALGNALVHSQRYADAERMLQQARRHYLAAQQFLDAARMGVGHVGILAYTGKSEEALALAAEIEPMLTIVGKTDDADLQRLGKLLMNTGVAYELLGRYEEALATYERQQTIAETLGDPLMLAQLANNQAYALVQIGAYTEAIAVYQRAEQLFHTTNAQTETVRFYYNYAALLTMVGEFSAARQLQDKADQVLLHIDGAEPQRRWFVLMRTMLDLQAGWPVTATTLAALQYAQHGFAQDGPIFAAGLTWVVLSRCHLHRAEYQHAHTALEQAQRHAEQYTDRTLLYRVFYGFGQVAAAQGEAASAIVSYTAAIQQIESIRNEFQIEILRADYLTDKLIVYQDLIRLYVRGEQYESAFHWVERAKARLLTEKLTFRLSQEAESLSFHQNDQLQQLNTQLRHCLQQLDLVYQRAQIEGLQEKGQFGSVPHADTAADLNRWEQQAQLLLQQIQRQQPLFSAYATGEPLPLARITEKLINKCLLQYHVNNGEVWGFLVGVEGKITYHHLAPFAEVERARQGFATTVEQVLELSLRYGMQRSTRYLPTLTATANHYLQQLYQLLFQPLEAHLAPLTSLIIVPDQTLHYIPFQALYDGEHYLLERYTISYTPSATALALCLEHVPGGEGVLLCGYDDQHLAAVTTEVTALQEFLPNAHCFYGADCSAERFLQSAVHYRVVHLATHAKFRKDKPLLSSLTLADRQLTLGEIARLHLNADLVVLSGCETGHGQLHGTDLVSLSSTFLSAGASSLVVSLWRVEDSITATVMTAFYQALCTGRSRAEALRQAQLTILQPAGQHAEQQQLFRHPTFWAPFVLVGSWQPILPFA